jgi:hypothetical protein
MRTIRTFLVALVLLLAPRPATATDFFVFKAALTLPATTVIEQPTAPTDLFLTRKIGNNDLVNLALGRALGTKVDAKTEILALAITYASEATKSRLIVFDPSQNGVAQIKAIVAEVESLTLQYGYKATSIAGVGNGGAIFKETTIGDAASFALLPSTLSGGAAGAGPFGFGQFEKIAGKGTLTGRIRYRFTDGAGTRIFDGIVTGGKLKAAGKPLGTFTE